MPYDLEGARSFVALSRFELRRLGSIGNAIEIQIEEGYGNSETVMYLIKALYAAASIHEKATASNIVAVIKKMESLVSKMKT